VQALEIEKVLGLAPLFGKEGLGEILLQITFHGNINELLFCKIPLNPPFPKGEARSRILSPSL